MSQYSASVPSDGQVRPEIKTFFEKFYEISDSPTGHEEYGNFFTKNATLIMGPNESSGRDAIIHSRPAMWEKVSSRSHKPTKIYAFGAGADDVMLHGTVDYVLKDGRKTTVPWAAQADFAREDSQLRMERYVVLLDTGAMARAK